MEAANPRTLVAPSGRAARPTFPFRSLVVVEPQRVILQNHVWREKFTLWDCVYKPLEKPRVCLKLLIEFRISFFFGFSFFDHELPFAGNLC